MGQRQLVGPVAEEMHVRVLATEAGERPRAVDVGNLLQPADQPGAHGDRQHEVTGRPPPALQAGDEEGRQPEGQHEAPQHADHQSSIGMQQALGPPFPRPGADEPASHGIKGPGPGQGLIKTGRGKDQRQAGKCQAGPECVASPEPGFRGRTGLLPGTGGNEGKGHGRSDAPAGGNQSAHGINRVGKSIGAGFRPCRRLIYRALPVQRG